MLTFMRWVAASLLAAVAATGNSVPITNTFTVSATGGPLAGVASTGTFSFDDSSVVPGAANDSVGLLTSLDFDWNGVHYDETSANTGRLQFGSGGALSGAVFGNNCFAGSCAVLAGNEQWFVNFPFRFTYSVEGLSISSINAR